MLARVLASKFVVADTVQRSDRREGEKRTTPWMNETGRASSALEKTFLRKGFRMAQDSL
jgi:hypothetical protein